MVLTSARMFFLAALCLPAVSHGQARPRPIGDADMAVHGVKYGADTLVIRRRLGAPLRRTTYKWPDAEEPLTAWVYRDVTFNLDITSDVLLIDFRGPRLKTARGIGIGDSIAAVRRVYGAPYDQGGVPTDTWVYFSEADDGGAVMFVIENGRVTQVMIGTVPGMD